MDGDGSAEEKQRQSDPRLQEQTDRLLRDTCASVELHKQQRWRSSAAEKRYPSSPQSSTSGRQEGVNTRKAGDKSSHRIAVPLKFQSNHELKWSGGTLLHKCENRIEFATQAPISSTSDAIVQYCCKAPMISANHARNKSRKNLLAAQCIC